MAAVIIDQLHHRRAADEAPLMERSLFHAGQSAGFKAGGGFVSLLPAFR
ncbi:hypothetical protein KCP75_15445 [Salmonella enterica subsp. enterica]|nr:hypothetical protein KCP75_15445 [Salmonella enterica subsp. enterica]